MSEQVRVYPDDELEDSAAAWISDHEITCLGYSRVILSSTGQIIVAEYRCPDQEFHPWLTIWSSEAAKERYTARVNAELEKR